MNVTEMQAEILKLLGLDHLHVHHVGILLHVDHLPLATVTYYPNLPASDELVTKTFECAHGQIFPLPQPGDTP